MQKMITLFMWGYQGPFRWSLEHKAKQVLQAVAPLIEPRVLLVGVRTPEFKDGHPVCVEPEDEEWNPSIFFECKKRTDEIFKDHPDHNMFYGDEPRMRDKPENIRRRSALEAVREVTSIFDTQNGTKSFCGWPQRIQGYHVIPVLQIKEAQLHAYPSLPRSIHFQDWESATSLIQSIVECLLEDATTALSSKEPGRFFDEMPADNSAVLRRAADRFCQAITLATKDVSFRNIFNTLNVVSSLAYEGEGAIGEILFSSEGSDAIDVHVQFSTPVPLFEHRLARKVVEMSGQGLACVCQGTGGLSGLGTPRPDAEDDLFRVVFSGHYEWDLYFKSQLLMQAAFGVPKLPIPRLTHEEFYATARRIFRGLTFENSGRLWRLISTCMEQRRGTMLVISESAQAEARRLRNQSIGVEPTELTSELVRRLSGIDGAILTDPNGVSYAIGVILDGIATDEGDRSRGARYNSAIRYLASATSGTMCLVISEDGDIDMLPRLQPQILQSNIVSQVEALRTKDIEDFHKTIKWLEEHRFYLTASQCEIVNAEVTRIYSAPMEVGIIRFGIQRFIPNPAMNDSYYINE